MTPKQALQLACQRAGGVTALATRLDISPSAVGNWLGRRRPIPAERAVQIEEATGVLRQELRPDLWPLEKRA